MFMWRTNKSADRRNADGWAPGEVSSLLAGGGVPTFRQSLPRINAELDRARRYTRSLTFALFSVDRAADAGAAMFAGAGTEGWPGHQGQRTSDELVPVVLACLLREEMRETDIVTYVSTQNRCIVVMPEVDAAEARLAAARLHELSAARLTSPVRAGIAVFPQDGLTLEELVRCAEERAQRAVQGPRLVETGTGGASLSFR